MGPGSTTGTDDCCGQLALKIEKDAPDLIGSDVAAQREGKYLALRRGRATLARSGNLRRLLC